MLFSRRGLLGQGLMTAGGLVGASLDVRAATGAGGSPGAMGSYGQAPISVEDLRFPTLADELHALLRVECSLEPVDVPVWGHWTAYLVVPGKGPLPIVDYEGLELTRAVRRSDGSYFVTGVDLSYPRDHRTGRFTSTVRNPVTGETLEVPTNVLDGSTGPGFVVSPEVGWWPLGVAKPASIDLHCRWWRESDRGRLLREQSPPPEAPQTIFIGSNYEFPMAAFADPGVPSIPWRSGGVYTFPVPKWLKMGDRDGHMLGMTSGQKLRSVKDLPREFLARTEREHPHLLSLDALFRTVPPP